MSMPLPDDLIAPEFTIDEPPLDEATIAKFSELVRTYADLAGLSLVEAAVELAGPDYQGTGDEDEVPESVRAFMTGQVDPERMEWAMAHVATIDAEAAAAREQRNVMVARMDDWLSRQTRALAGRRGFFESYLTSALRAAHEADDKVKSIALPSGRVTSTGPAKGRELVVELIKENEAELVVWLESALAGQPELYGQPATADSAEVKGVVRVVKSVLVSELRKIVAADPTSPGVARRADDGTPVPHVAVTHKEREYKVVPG